MGMKIFTLEKKYVSNKYLAKKVHTTVYLIKRNYVKVVKRMNSRKGMVWKKAFNTLSQGYRFSCLYMGSSKEV